MTIGRRGWPLLLTAAVAGLAVALTGCAADPESSPVPTFAAPLVHATSAPASPAPSRVVALGDSLMSGYNLLPEQAWPVLLGARARVALTNLACPGMGFVVQGECGTSYAGFVPAVAALQPQLLIVESSSNDFWEDGDEIRSDTADTVDQLHAAAPDARIVGLSTIWNDDPDVPDDTAVTSDALRDAVQAVGGTFVDVGQPLVGHPEWMQDDDVHPTPRGQRAIEQTVMSALQDAGVLP
ncbi:lipolytic protein G-D-S-L family [Microbacterium sp. HMWF026]|uniref:SGNH/GDSL hydrolase family protein n=1 Tax=Microbacterium sp. HMWF026 TaxID=2056861 RepID=UPI000D3BCD79|nr:SGNH/GDSL hydrolase family protein [Microbacterium sp. HMWF026]PTT19325.1 lipolytic protein G-D-S-L family [Microbacterium sp. HMWF026]